MNDQLDQETIDIINKIANYHARAADNRKFGYLKKEDITNEIWVICLEAIQEFDPKYGKLEHFLRVVTRNRLANQHKSILGFVRSPCPKCEFFDKDGIPDCMQFGEDKHLCSKYAHYMTSKQSRSDLLVSSETKINREMEENVLERMVGKEFVAEIKPHLSNAFTNDFEKFITGAKISDQRFKKLKYEILRIMQELKDNKTTELTINGEKI